MNSIHQLFIQVTAVHIFCLYHKDDHYQAYFLTVDTSCKHTCIQTWTYMYTRTHTYHVETGSCWLNLSLAGWWRSTSRPLYLHALMSWSPGHSMWHRMWPFVVCRRSRPLHPFSRQWRELVGRWRHSWWPLCYQSWGQGHLAWWWTVEQLCRWVGGNKSLLVLERVIMYIYWPVQPDEISKSNRFLSHIYQQWIHGKNNLYTV